MRAALPIVALTLAACAHEPPPAAPAPPPKPAPAPATPAGELLEGRVTGPEGQPLAGVLVALVTPGGAEAQAPVAWARSQPDGRFRLTGVPAGRYGLTATTTGLAASYHAGIELAAGARGAELPVRLAAGGVTLSGTVRARDGGPLPGAELRAARYSEEEADVFYAFADAQGRYAMTLPEARYILTAAAPGHYPEQKGVEPGASRTVDLALEVDVPLPPTAVADAVAWLKRQAFAVATPEAGRGFQDLAPLGALIGEARVVALGEATHGTREFFQMKHRVLEYLVSELGFTVFAIEAFYPESLAVNDYVLSGKGDPAQALAGLGFWTWDTEEVLEMIRWMRRWNEDPRHTRKVRFYGFDMQSPPRAVRHVLGYLQRVDPAYARELAPVLAPLRAPAATGSYGQQPAQVRAAVSAALARLVARFSADRQGWVARSGEASWAVARQHAVVAAQGEAMLASDSGVAIRDRAMADNVQWLLAQEPPGTRMVLWAHNGHVSKAGYTGVESMGVHLARALGRQLVVLGFAFHRGGFRAVEMPMGPASKLRDFDVGPAQPGSLDATLASAGLQAAIVDLRPASGTVAAWLDKPHATRSIGAGYGEALDAAFHQSLKVREHYDGLIFFERTTPARAVVPRRPDRPKPGAATNLGLEQGKPGAAPPGWIVPGASIAAGYTIALAGKGCRQGRRCAVVRRPMDVGGGAFGNLMQSVDATPYRGKKVRLRAQVRADVPDGIGQAQLWLRVDRPGGQMGFFYNMDDRPITAATWSEHGFEGEVAPDATTVNFGMFLMGDGAAYLDDVRLEVVP